ncbi:MAG: extracellular solute-binding protein [Lachnospiraceae bacterium]|nr:extracellular solute-binding protein [Lachnospiraceae bacterium]
MKRKILAAILTTVMAGSLLTACGNPEVAGTSEPAPEAQTQEQAPADGAPAATDSTQEIQTVDTSSVASGEDAVNALIANTTGPVDLTVWAAEEDQDMVKGWCDDFAAQYPDVNLSFNIGVQSESTAKDTILTDPEAAADVFSFAGDQVTDLVAAGALQEVSIDTDKIIEDCGGMEAGAVQAAVRDGKLYAYPATADNGYFMFYNKEYFSEDDVKSMDTMLEKAAEAGKKVSMQFDSGWYSLSFFVGAGFELSANPDGSTTMDWNGTSKDGIKGTDVVQSMLDIAANPGFLSTSDAEFVTGLTDGSIIAGVNGTWNAEVAANTWGDNYGATHLPTFTCAGKQIQMSSVAGYKLFGVNPHSKNVGWAMLLAEYFTDYDRQLERFTLRGAGPANAKAAASEEVLSDPAIAALASQSQFAILDGCEGGNFWTPTETFGAIIASGNPEGKDLQELLDNLVDGVSQPVAE